MTGSTGPETEPAPVEIPEELPEPIHTRDYEVIVYNIGDGRMLIEGRLEDIRPQGLMPPDPDPLTVHEMVVKMVVEAATFKILFCTAKMKIHPHAECTEIEDRYRQLEGLSIARGFTHKVRELLGGPLGCAHLTALIQAMAPAAIQGAFSMRMEAAGPALEGIEVTPEMERQARWGMLQSNRGTCHIFADDGPAFRAFEAGEEWKPPLWALERLKKLDVEYDDFFSVWRRRPGPGDAG